MGEIPSSKLDIAARRELASWRRRLLPFAILIIIAVLSFFIWTTHREFNEMKVSITASSGNDQIMSAIASYHVTPDDDDDIAQKVQLLTAERMQRANLNRASASLLLSLWTREMGFVTGMILAIVGATFVLTRLDDAGSKLEAGDAGLKGSLATTSPGIVLAVLGTILMGMAMSVRYTESGKDMIPVPASAAAPITAAFPSADTLEDLAEAPAANPAGGSGPRKK